MEKKKLPKVLVLLDEDMCTGCEACLCVSPVASISRIPGPRHEPSFQVSIIDLPRCISCTLCHHVCPWVGPVDCISTIPGPRHETSFHVCTIDLPRCIGCTLCYQVCPWDCITMIPTDQFLQNKNTKPQLT